MIGRPEAGSRHLGFVSGSGFSPFGVDIHALEQRQNAMLDSWWAFLCPGKT